MNANEKYPKTLVQAVRYFSDLDIAHAFFTSARWPDGVVYCPHCGNTNVKFLANYRRWECKNKHPKRQFTVKVGTIMEDSPLGLDKWAVAFWLEANAKNSISSYEVHRALGITQKSAWFMQHRIRLAMQKSPVGKMGGVVEADETIVGGRAHNMHEWRRRKVISDTGSAGTNKTIVMGLLCRGGEVRTNVIKDADKPTIHDVIHKNVKLGTTIYTDAFRPYRSLSPEFLHDFVDHTVQYVRGNVHTNGLENFWSLFKRCLATHVAVEPCHMIRYLDAEIFRYDNRELRAKSFDLSWR